MNKKDLDKFITENRAEIDEFLGPNNPIYTTIILKGQITKEFKDKDRSMDYFGVLMGSGLSLREQNNYLRKLLKELRGISKHTNVKDPLMRFGIDSKLLLGKDKRDFMRTMGLEFIDDFDKCPEADKYCIKGKKCQRS